MSTGNIGLDILLDEILKADSSSSTHLKEKVLAEIQGRYNISTKEAKEIFNMISSLKCKDSVKTELIVTSPPSFNIKAKTTKNTVMYLLNNAEKEIILTGYSLSDYFEDMVDCIIRKSQSGVLVKFFANNLDGEAFNKLLLYKGRYLRIYNYNKNTDDKMAALHAKVICVDQEKALITSANLSYHGQEGNIEMGTLTTSSKFTKQISDFFTTLLFKKVFTEL